MAKGTYIGIADKARKVKKLYFGVADKARKVKKVYFGVDGKARLVYSAGPMLASNTNILGARVVDASYNSNHAGMYSGSRIVYFLDKQLVKSERSLTGSTRGSAKPASNKTHLFFGGGSDSSSPNGSIFWVDAYNASLVRYDCGQLPPPQCYGIASASVGNFAIFFGGYNFTTIAEYRTYYDSSLVQRTSTTYPRRREACGITLPNHALFGGGYGGYSGSDYLSDVYRFDSSMVQTTISNLSYPESSKGGVSVGGNAIFAGGSRRAANIDAYNSSFVKVQVADLPFVPELNLNKYVGCASLGDYALFMEGGKQNAGGKSKMSYFDSGLVRTDFQPITINNPYNTTFGFTGASIGDKAIFNGYNEDLVFTS